MLDKQTRSAILGLCREGHSIRHVSRLLSLSPTSVRKVVRSGSDEPPTVHRRSKLDSNRERIVQLLMECDGNVFKLQRALADEGAAVHYSTLTAFCRRNHLLDTASDPRLSAS